MLRSTDRTAHSPQKYLAILQKLVDLQKQVFHKIDHFLQRSWSGEKPYRIVVISELSKEYLFMFLIKGNVLFFLIQYKISIFWTVLACY